VWMRLRDRFNLAFRKCSDRRSDVRKFYQLEDHTGPVKGKSAADLCDTIALLKASVRWAIEWQPT